MKTLLLVLTVAAKTAVVADVPWLDIGDVTRSPASTDAKTESLVLAAATQDRPNTPLALFDSVCRIWQLSNPIAVFDSHKPGAYIILH